MRVMRTIASLLVLFVLATAAGMFWRASELRGMSERVEVGPWVTDPDIGAPSASPALRARVALNGLLAMSRQEAIYYNAETDSDGAPLRGDCRYLVQGSDPPARWWSITLYGQDGYLLRNGQGRHSLSADTVSRPYVRDDGKGPWDIYIGPDGPPDDKAWDWVSSRGAEAFALTLRLYGPEPSVMNDVGSPVLPTIRVLGCEAAR